MQIGSMRWLFAAIVGALSVPAGLAVAAGLKARTTPVAGVQTFRSAAVEAGAQAAPGTISGQVKLTSKIRGTALPTPMYPSRTIGRQATRRFRNSGTSSCT